MRIMLPYFLLTIAAKFFRAKWGKIWFRKGQGKRYWIPFILRWGKGGDKQGMMVWKRMMACAGQALVPWKRKWEEGLGWRQAHWGDNGRESLCLTGWVLKHSL